MPESLLPQMQFPCQSYGNTEKIPGGADGGKAGLSSFSGMQGTERDAKRDGSSLEDIFRLFLKLYYVMLYCFSFLETVT